MPRDSTPPSASQDTGVFPLYRSPPHLKMKAPIEKSTPLHSTEKCSPFLRNDSQKKVQIYTENNYISVLGGCPMPGLLCYYSMFLSTFKSKVNFLGPPYLPPCIDQSLSPIFEAPTMREHSPMFQTYTPVGKSETQTWAAINFKIRVAGKTGMVAKIGWSALSHGIFHTNAVTFVILLQILVLLSSIDKSFQLVCSIEDLD